MTDAATLDLDNIAHYSAATRAYEREVADLTVAIETARTQAADTASQWKREDIARAASELGVAVKPSAPKGDLVAVYAKAVAEAADASKRYGTLKQQAMFDLFLARRLNEDINDALDAATAVTDGFSDLTPGNVIHALSWRTDETMVAQWRAHYALQVIRSTAGGLDIHEATAKVARDAMFVVMGFPSHIKSNGTGSAYRLEDTTKAVAAADFVRDVAMWALGDMVPTAWLSR